TCACTNIFSSVVVFVDCVASVVTAGVVVFAVATGFAILAPELHVATYVLFPVTGAKNAYCIPFIVCVVNDTELPLRVIEINVPLCELNCIIALMFVALLRAVTSNVSWLLLHDMFPNEELFLPSNHVNACFAEIMGTLRVF